VVYLLYWQEQVHAIVEAAGTPNDKEMEQALAKAFLFIFR